MRCSTPSMVHVLLQHTQEASCTLPVALLSLFFPNIYTVIQSSSHRLPLTVYIHLEFCFTSLLLCNVSSYTLPECADNSIIIVSVFSSSRSWSTAVHISRVHLSFTVPFAVTRFSISYYVSFSSCVAVHVCVLYPSSNLEFSYTVFRLQLILNLLWYQGYFTKKRSVNPHEIKE